MGVSNKRLRLVRGGDAVPDRWNNVPTMGLQRMFSPYPGDYHVETLNSVPNLHVLQ
jgi:hypothetical protein